MKNTHERGWVLPLVLLGLTVVSGLSVSAWRHATQGAEGFGHALQHERSRQLAHAQLHASEAAWLSGAALPPGVEVRTVLSADLGWSKPDWLLQRFTASGFMGDSRVVLESTWAVPLDEHGQAQAPAQRLSWREVWP